LVEIAARKLAALDEKYLRTPKGTRRKSPLKGDVMPYEANLVILTASIYGIELLADNVATARARLFEVIWTHGQAVLKEAANPKLADVLRFVIGQNIVHGDTLAFTRQDEGHVGEPIVFAEWSLLADFGISRRDFGFEGLAMDTDAPDMTDKQKLNAAYVDDMFSVELNEAQNPVFLPKEHKQWPRMPYTALADKEVSHAA
jgi:hypothetical protein